MKGGTGWLILILMSLLVILGIQAAILLGGTVTPPSTESGGDRLRDYAATLKANQLYAQSAEAYDEYLSQSSLADSEKAKIDFNTGSMLLDQGGDPEEALARFLRVTDLYEGVDTAILKQSRRLAAECLEKLGRSGSAEQKLIESTRLVKEATQEVVQTPEESEILARIGQRVAITRSEFEEEWKRIPLQLKQAQFEGEKGKEQFLQELLGMRLYAEAARRKGLDRDPDIQRRLRTLEESVLSSLLMQKEVSEKIQTPESDLNLFYEAHKARYHAPGSVEAAHILVADPTQATAAKAAIDAGSSFEQVAAAFSLDERTKMQGGKLGILNEAPVPLDNAVGFDPTDVVIPGLGKANGLTRVLFGNAEIGSVTGPIQSELGYHFALISNRTPAKPKTFEEARPEVERDLRAMREEERRKELLGELMRTHEVKIYATRLGS